MTGHSPFTQREAASLLDGMAAIVSRAALAIAEHAGSARAARIKADRSPVTDADLAAQAVILEGLAALMPGIPIVSEEAAWDKGRTPGGLFFLVDPLDGTREFVNGRDEYTVNVALVAGGEPMLGAIGAPARGRLWLGGTGVSAERIDLAPGAAPDPARARTLIRTRAWPEHAVAALSRSHLDPRTEAFVQRVAPAGRLSCGSALKFCLVAEGTADVYPRLAPTCEWDIAAGHAILGAAGGVMTAPDGTPLPYGRSDARFLVPGFIAWGDAQAARRHAIR